jgi:excisionase family DNA binding protein
VPDNDLPLLLTVQEAAKQLSVHRATLYDLMADQEIPFVTIGSRRRIRSEDLLNFIAGLTPTLGSKVAANADDPLKGDLRSTPEARVMLADAVRG